MTCNYVYTVKSTSITDDGTTTTITVPNLNFATFSNLQKINVILCQNIPSTACTHPVVLSDGTYNITMNVRTGNYLRADQLKSRKKYRLIFGNDPYHFSLLDLICESDYEFTGTSGCLGVSVTAEPVEGVVVEPMSASAVEEEVVTKSAKK